MIKIVKKGGKYITRCGGVETLIAPLELREVSRKVVKPLKLTRCGLITNIAYKGEEEIRYAS